MTFLSDRADFDLSADRQESEEVFEEQMGPAIK